jgi:hypothetical protein
LKGKRESSWILSKSTSRTQFGSVSWTITWNWSKTKSSFCKLASQWRKKKTLSLSTINWLKKSKRSDLSKARGRNSSRITGHKSQNKNKNSLISYNKTKKSCSLSLELKATKQAKASLSNPYNKTRNKKIQKNCVKAKTSNNSRSWAESICSLLRIPKSPSRKGGCSNYKTNLLTMGTRWSILSSSKSMTWANTLNLFRTKLYPPEGRNSSKTLLPLLTLLTSKILQLSNLKTQNKASE